MKKMPCTALAVLAVALLTLAAANIGSATADMPKCLFVSSYHKGYAWSDGVERGLRAVLAGRCEVRQFDMDTKRFKSPAENVERALAAKVIIDEWQPDIVIAADDNAAKYLVQPHYRDHALPFVFCGVNWTVEEYGFPYSNVTGMIEVAPITPMLERARNIVPGMRRAFYIGADTLTEEKNLERFRQASRKLGLELDWALTTTMDDWLRAYERAQEADLVIMGSNAGINDWNAQQARAGVLATTRKLSVTNHEWMMPYTIIGMTKVPEEHGEWAAQAALAILGGAKPSEIPIVPNERRDLWVNAAVVKAAKVTLPDSMLRKAKKVADLAEIQ